MDSPSDFEPGDVPYLGWDDLDFSIITKGMKWLPFFDDDLYLGMQAMNVGIVDSVITESEYAQLREWFEIEKTPTETAMAVHTASRLAPGIQAAYPQEGSTPISRTHP